MLKRFVIMLIAIFVLYGIVEFYTTIENRRLLQEELRLRSTLLAEDLVEYGHGFRIRENLDSLSIAEIDSQNTAWLRSSSFYWDLRNHNYEVRVFVVDFSDYTQTMIYYVVRETSDSEWQIKGSGKYI